MFKIDFRCWYASKKIQKSEGFIQKNQGKEATQWVWCKKTEEVGVL